MMRSCRTREGCGKNSKKRQHGQEGGGPKRRRRVRQQEVKGKNMQQGREAGERPERDINSLPDEILLKIYSYLTQRGAWRLWQTSRKFMRLRHDVARSRLRLACRRRELKRLGCCVEGAMVNCRSEFYPFLPTGQFMASKLF